MPDYRENLASLTDETEHDGLVLRCLGYDRREQKYVLEATGPNVRLNFIGEDAERFVQFNPPTENTEDVEFSLTIRVLMDKFPDFLPVIQ